MGNFPYPSSYMTNGAGDLPAYPVRVACSIMTEYGVAKDGPRLMEGQRALVMLSLAVTAACRLR
jgi:lysosomal Pro-X carboxypeptidase